MSAPTAAQPHDTVVWEPKSRQVSKRLAALRLLSELLHNRVHIVTAASGQPLPELHDVHKGSSL